MLDREGYPDGVFSTTDTPEALTALPPHPCNKPNPRGSVHSRLRHSKRLPLRWFPQVPCKLVTILLFYVLNLTFIEQIEVLDTRRRRASRSFGPSVHRQFACGKCARRLGLSQLEVYISRCPRNCSLARRNTRLLPATIPSLHSEVAPPTHPPHLTKCLPRQMAP